MRLAVFDCDGTLVDSVGRIVAAMQATFRAARLPPPDSAAVRRVIGLSLEQAMAALRPEASPTEAADLADRYRQAFRSAAAAHDTPEPLFPGVKALLGGLARDGWLLSIATGKSNRGLRRVLEGHGLTHHFVSLETADHHPSKPHPAMLFAAMAGAGVGTADTVMIGDTTYDIDMARAAGVRAIGVAWGYHSVQSLLAAGAANVAGSVGELRELLDASPTA